LEAVPGHLLSNLAPDEFISTSAGVFGPAAAVSLLIALTGRRVVDTKIVLCNVGKKFSAANSIAARRSFACQGEVALEYLVGAAADLDVGAIAVECLIVLAGNSWFAV